VESTTQVGVLPSVTGDDRTEFGPIDLRNSAFSSLLRSLQVVVVTMVAAGAVTLALDTVAAAAAAAVVVIVVGEFTLDGAASEITSIWGGLRCGADR
jgi:hypothetical protein